jgi:hypothetical protein
LAILHKQRLTPNRRLESIQEWSDFMKISSTWNFRSIVGKIMLGLVLVSMIGSIDVLPALGRDNDNRGRYENRGRGYDHRYEGRRDYRPYRYYGHSGYRERAYYPPPPVVYEPPPPPGISIFFPPLFIRP